MNRFQSLVGKPYAFPSTPPLSFDCWTLVKYVRGELGLSCPLPFCDDEPWCVPGNLQAATARARGHWLVLDGPKYGAMAMLEPAHVGVVLDNGVLHALSRNSSVVLTSMIAVRRVWPRVEWWEAA